MPRTAIHGRLPSVLVGEPLPKQVLDSAVNPDAIPDQTFDVARRGYDQQQVQQYLQAVADSLQDAQQREADIRTRLGKAVRRAEKAERVTRQSPEPTPAEPADLNHQLGVEVTSVLDAARVAGEKQVADMAATSNVQAQAVREQARKDANAMLTDAAARVEQARNECDALIREAEEARAQILEDMERRRRQARAQVERLRVGRDRLLRSYDVVRRTLDETTVDLKSSLKEAKVRGDSAARAIAAEPLANRQQLEAELADAKLIGRVKISDPAIAPAPSAPKPQLRSPALPRPLDPPPQIPQPASDAHVDPNAAPTPRKPRVSEAMKAASRKSMPAQPKAPAVAPMLTASPAAERDADVTEADLAKLEDDNLNVVEPADEIEEVTALPVEDSGSGSELFALLRIQSSKDKKKAKKFKKKSPANGSAQTKAPQADVEKAKDAEVADELIPGLDAQRDAVIADAAEQLEKRLKRALADEQNDLLASIRAAKKKKTVELTAVVGDIDTHVKRYVVAINEVAAVTYGAGAALIDVEPSQGMLPAGAVEELLEADVVLPIRERLESLDALKVTTADNHVDPVRAFYRQRKTDHLGFAASRLAQLLCVAGLHDAQSES